MKPLAPGILLSAAVLLAPRPPVVETSAFQSPQFRTAIDLVSVDVQVVTSDGSPAASLIPADFDVSIGGQKHLVVSAEYISSGVATGSPATATPTAAAPTAPAAKPTLAAGRIYLLAIDALSFDVGVSRGAAEAARRFVAKLAPTDAIGVFTFPLGPKLDPTTDHAAVLRALDQVTGQKDPPLVSGAAAQLSASELVDFAPDSRSAMETILRVCGGKMDQRGAITQAPDLGCRTRLEVDVKAQMLAFEAQAQASLGMLGQLFDALATTGRHTNVVLVSGGLPVSNRPGGRPDIGELPLRVGEKVARANSTLYTLFLDSTFLQRFAAENRYARTSMAARDSSLQMQWLDQFTGKAGGALMRIQAGNGDPAFDRVLRETSAYYLLGVQVAAADRDGRLREIDVNVRGRGLIVRARKWVVVPKLPSDRQLR
jgi:VWFA-related protein